MRRSLGIVLISFSLLGLWNALSHWLDAARSGRPTPSSCPNGNPDGCPPGAPPH